MIWDKFLLLPNSNSLTPYPGILIIVKWFLKKMGISGPMTSLAEMPWLAIIFVAISQPMHDFDSVLNTVYGLLN